jgi:hypothetical protein
MSAMVRAIGRHRYRSCCCGFTKRTCECMNCGAELPYARTLRVRSLFGGCQSGQPRRGGGRELGLTQQAVCGFPARTLTLVEPSRGVAYFVRPARLHFGATSTPAAGGLYPASDAIITVQPDIITFYRQIGCGTISFVPQPFYHVARLVYIYIASERHPMRGAFTDYRTGGRCNLVIGLWSVYRTSGAP